MSSIFPPIDGFKGIRHLFSPAPNSNGCVVVRPYVFKPINGLISNVYYYLKLAKDCIRLL